MANEYLKRTPTSSGNRKVFTWAGWVKRNQISSDSFIFSAGSLASNWGGIHLNSTRGVGLLDIVSSTQLQVQTSEARRDASSWLNIVVSVDTTKETSENRVKMYVNGINLTSFQSYTVTQNYNTWVNSLTMHGVGRLFDGATTFATESEMFDVFFVDGQALTPDVFGYHKDGAGYISAGSAEATSFKRGQWVPKKPSSIKAAINAEGGFGVNGFYLPINDASNMGADFHCEPNSIITLKGENNPQPRNGAPETTDAYVSQLRTDPYAANLVLAVPGIALENTNTELVTNGTFDTDISSWNSVQYGTGTITWRDGTLVLGGQDGTSANYADLHQQVTGLTIGTRYYFSFETSRLGYLCRLGTTGKYSQDVFGIEPGTEYKFDFEFEATATTLDITFHSRNNSGEVYFDNISLKEAIPVRDYSADIKGSGSNKTPTLSGSSGVGYELGGYYGSAYTSSSNNDYLEFPGTSGDFNVGTGDFTIEMWLNPDSTQTTNARIFGQDANSAGNWDVYINGTSASNQIYMMGGGVSLTGGSGSSYGNLVGEQWNHFCLERYNGQLTTYMNGVAVYTQTYTSSIGDSNPFRIAQIGSNAYGGVGYGFNGDIQDFRFYKGVAKYKGGFDVPKPYTPVGFESWRAVPDCTANNFATLNPLIPSPDTLTNGNLTVAGGAGKFSQGTIGISSSVGGKWYFEFNPSNVGGSRAGAVGWAATSYDITVSGYFSYRNSGTYYPPNTAYGDSWTIGDTVGIALDVDNGRIFASKNGVWQNSGDPVAGTNPMASNIFSGLTNSVLVPLVEGYGSGGPAGSFNFGQNPTFSGNTTAGTYTDSNGKGLFKYQPPSGFLALCEDNLPTPAIKNPGEYFKGVLYTGSQTPRSIQGLGFKPDLVWIKVRSEGGSHVLFDSVRGPALQIKTNSPDAEYTDTVNLTSFDDDGFSLGSGYTSVGTNGSGRTYVAWCWRAGAGTTSTNTDGSIQSVVSANQTAGFSIVSYTGDGNAGATFGHGLGKTPGFIIVKRRDSASQWNVWTSSLTNNQALYLNLTNSIQSSTTFWNDTDPNSSVITLGTDRNVLNGTYIAYCWAEIEGFSKFGSYVGNASTDGPFVYCGFKPALVMIKSSTVATNWYIFDNSRKPTNPITGVLFSNTSDVETFNAHDIDFLSNGFKVRQASGYGGNNNGATYIFAAFAESPFQTANAK